MRTIFNQLKFSRETESSKSIKRTKWEFFIPGVNSGVYSPASVCVQVRIEEIKSGFFKLVPRVSYSDITLTPREFDELFEEMRKIKELRDNFDKNK